MEKVKPLAVISQRKILKLNYKRTELRKLTIRVGGSPRRISLIGIHGQATNRSLGKSQTKISRNEFRKGRALFLNFRKRLDFSSPSCEFLQNERHGTCDKIEALQMWYNSYSQVLWK